MESPAYGNGSDAVIGRSKREVTYKLKPKTTKRQGDVEIWHQLTCLQSAAARTSCADAAFESSEERVIARPEFEAEIANLDRARPSPK